MYYWFIPLILLAIAVIGYILYVRFAAFRSRRHVSSAKRRKPRNIPSYELSSWIDEEVAKDKLYRKPDMSAFELADELDMSVWQLSAILRKTYDKSVSEYLNERRVQAACRLLWEASDMSLDEISFEAGFASVNTFHSVFKNIMGLTPEKYRSQMK